MFTIFAFIAQILVLELAPRATLSQTWILRATIKVMLWRHWWCHHGPKWYHFTWFGIQFSYLKLNLSHTVLNMDFWKFTKIVLIFEIGRSSKATHKLQCVKQMSRETKTMTICVSTLYDKSWPGIIKFNICLDTATSSLTLWVCNT